MTLDTIAITYIKRLGELKFPVHASLHPINIKDEYGRGERGSCYIISDKFTTNRLRDLVDNYLGIPERADFSTTLKAITYVLPLTWEQVIDPGMLSDLGSEGLENFNLSAVIGRAHINHALASSSKNDWIINMRNLTESILAKEFGRDNYGVRINGSGGRKYFDPRVVIAGFSQDLQRREFPKYS